MDKLYINGKIHTMDKNDSIVEALGITDGLITFSGSNADAAKLTADEVIDLKGALMLPGFCDSHMHLINYAFVKSSLKLYDAKSKEDIIWMLRVYLEKNKDLKYVYGRGFNEKDFIDKILPTKIELDEICPNIPIMLSRVCGHMALCNSKTIEFLKRQPRYQDEMKAQCIDEENGRLYEGALNLFFNSMPVPPVEYVKNLIRIAMKDLNGCGITSVQCDDFGAIPGGNPEIIIKAYEQLEECGEMTVRVYEQCLFSDNEKLLDFMEKGYVTGRGNDFFKIGPLKMLQDGSLGARTAALLSDYNDAPFERGIINFSQEALNEAVSLANKYKVQAAIHGIGDRAIEMILAAIENSGGNFGKELRHGIVHTQITNPALLKRMKSLGVVSYIQPVFLDSDLHIAESRLGAGRTKTSYAFRSMLDMGIMASGGSDAPVCPFNVMENIYFAVTRKDLSGFPDGGWLPEECLTIEQAVRLFTTNASYCSFSENLRGSLEPGKQADLVILDNDIFEIESDKIKDVSVLKTVVGGKIVCSNEKIEKMF